QLVGSALDDRLERLQRPALTWFAGSRRLGSGEQLRVTLPPGRVRLRLVARDRLGRVGTAARTVQLAPIPLRLVTRPARAKVGHRARSGPVTLAPTTAAVLRARGTRALVGSRARRVLIPLPARPARGVFTVPITIVAAGTRQSPVKFTLYVLRA